MIVIARRLRHLFARLGGVGLVGVLLLVAAAVAYFWTIRPMQREIAALRVEAQAAAQRAARGESSEAAERNGAPKRGTPVQFAGTSEQLGAFYASFPTASSTPEWLARINALAKTKGLVLQSGEYKVESPADDKLMRYQITLPVTGTYAQLRGFVAEVLAQVPAAALEDITLRRDGVSNAQLEARVRLILYLTRGQ